MKYKHKWSGGLSNDGDVAFTRCGFWDYANSQQIVNTWRATTCSKCLKCKGKRQKKYEEI